MNDIVLTQEVIDIVTNALRLYIDTQHPHEDAENLAWRIINTLKRKSLSVAKPVGGVH